MASGSPRMRLDEVIQRISSIPMDGTDCALPMVWARRHKLNVVGFDATGPAVIADLVRE